MYGFYKQRRGKILSGVLAAVASRFNWDVWIVRGVFVAVVVLLRGLGLLALAAYVLAAVLLPYKEDVDAERFGTGPRKTKDAEKL
ncbi:PspC domain-containing protein [Streptococcus gallolyticus]|uniref:PspC domain-containing protein n=1 Tax=Streptococcus hepaticus TaxID=3349163 RepID=UPI001C943139|nr:PspC domain-containing protein [Streptococcus gallolyticus]MBY5040384.1 PspC domain-containing protein [Streptococcus gallolyticus]